MLTNRKAPSVTPRCAIAVPARNYRTPGQCANSRDIQAVKVRDVVIMACSLHRQMLGNGRKLGTVR